MYEEVPGFALGAAEGPSSQGAAEGPSSQQMALLEALLQEEVPGFVVGAAETSCSQREPSPATPVVVAFQVVNSSATPVEIALQ